MPKFGNFETVLWFITILEQFITIYNNLNVILNNLDIILTILHLSMIEHSTDISVEPPCVTI